MGAEIKKDGGVQVYPLLRCGDRLFRNLGMYAFACISTAGHRQSWSNTSECLEYSAVLVIISVKCHTEENMYWKVKTAPT